MRSADRLRIYGQGPARWRKATGRLLPDVARDPFPDGHNAVAGGGCGVLGAGFPPQDGMSGGARSRAGGAPRRWRSRESEPCVGGPGRTASGPCRAGGGAAVRRRRRKPRSELRCSAVSRREHGRYVRYVADSGGRPVLVELSVRRLYCGNPVCAKATFVEQVTGLTERYQRRIRGLRALLQAVGVEVAGRDDRCQGGRRPRQAAFLMSDCSPPTG